MGEDDQGREYTPRVIRLVRAARNRSVVSEYNA
jgi:hypothetical protein